MPTKTFNLSLAALAYLTTLKGKNASDILDIIILEHRALSPAIRKREALTQMRTAITKLAQDHDIAEEAILSWAKDTLRRKK